MFILEHLLTIAAHMDLSDEVGRWVGQQLQVNKTTVPTYLQRLKSIFSISQEEIVKTGSRNDGQSRGASISRTNTS